MKNFSIFLIMFLFTPFAMAANMCIKNDVVMVALDPIIGGSSLSSDATGKTWSTSFSYGIISGIGACHTAAGGASGNVATNQQDKSPYTVGSYCYCKMLRPVPSQWVHSGGDYRSNATACASGCASFCASSVGTSVALRRGLFGSVGQ